MTCALEPGQQIVQSQLAHKYRIGITPVREALQRLTHEGYVQCVPRFGYTVSPITVSDIIQIHESRAIAESAAVRLAVARATDEQLRRIVANADFTYIYKNRRSYTHFLDQNIEFHSSIALAAGNTRLAEWVSTSLSELTRVFHFVVDWRDAAEEMRDEHMRLAQALAERDANRAEQMVRAQIARSQERILNALTDSKSTVLTEVLRVDRQAAFSGPPHLADSPAE